MTFAGTAPQSTSKAVSSANSSSRTEDINRHIGAVGVETGELISEMCNAVADNRVTPREAEAIDRRAEDVKDNISLLQADCRRIRVGGAS